MDWWGTYLKFAKAESANGFLEEMYQHDVKAQNSNHLFKEGESTLYIDEIGWDALIYDRVTFNPDITILYIDWIDRGVRAGFQEILREAYPNLKELYFQQNYSYITTATFEDLFLTLDLTRLYVRDNQSKLEEMVNDADAAYALLETKDVVTIQRSGYSVEIRKDVFPTR